MEGGITILRPLIKFGYDQVGRHDPRDSKDRPSRRGVEGSGNPESGVPKCRFQELKVSLVAPGVRVIPTSMPIGGDWLNA